MNMQQKNIQFLWCPPPYLLRYFSFPFLVSLFPSFSSPAEFLAQGPRAGPHARDFLHTVYRPLVLRHSFSWRTSGSSVLPTWISLIIVRGMVILPFQFLAALEWLVDLTSVYVSLCEIYIGYILLYAHQYQKYFIWIY